MNAIHFKVRVHPSLVQLINNLAQDTDKQYDKLTLTCSKIDKYITKKDCVWYAVKNNPVSAEIIVEERYGNWQDN